MLKSVIFLCSVAIIVAACTGAESSAKDTVRRSLKDPESAKFGEYTRVTEDKACLNVNAKNSMGGYTGEQVAYLLKRDDKWMVVAIERKSNHTQCVEIMKEQEASKKAKEK